MPRHFLVANFDYQTVVPLSIMAFYLNDGRLTSQGNPMSNTIHDSITLSRRLGLVFCAAATFWLWPSAVLAQVSHSLTVTAGTEQITVQHSAEWFSNKQFQNMEKLVHVSGNASIKVTTEERQSRAEAVQRVREIGAGLGAPSSAYMVIGGWPGFQHTG